MKNNSMKFSKVLVFVFLGITVVFPIVNLLLSININDFRIIMKSPQFKPMIFNSLFTTISAAIFSLTLAFALSWVINRSNIKFKSIFAVLFTLPMLIPSVSHGMGLVLLFGDNGIMTNLLGININLYGYNGIILGSILYSFPVAFLLINNIFQYEDYTVYEAANVLGLSSFQQFWTITLPNMKTTTISTFFAVFTMVFTDYGVPLIVGGKVMTLPVYMFREVIGLLNFSTGAIIGVILLIPAVIAFIIDIRSNDQINASTITLKYKISKNRLRDSVSFLFCMICVFLVSLPIVTFIFLSFVKQYPIDISFSLVNIQKALDIGLTSYLLNSITIALLTSLIGVGVTYFTAYLTARSDKTFSNLTLHLISMLSLAIPGVVLGLSYVLFFKNSFIYQTVIILVLVNIIHFFSSPYLLTYNSLKKFSSNLEDISESLGISKFRMLWDVYIPSTKNTIMESFSYLFVNSMVTISAVSFLANLRNMPLSLLIPQLDSQSMFEVTAIVSVVILMVNIFIKIFVYFVKARNHVELN